MANKFNISLEDAKAQLNVEHDEDDSIITLHLETAIEAVLANVNLGGVIGTKRTFQMTSQSVRMGYPASSDSLIVEEQICAGGSCSWMPMDADAWSMEAIDDLAQCLSITDEAFAEVDTTMRVSYTIALDTPPPAFVQAALLWMTHFYENRSAVVVGQGVSALPLPMAVEMVLAPHRSIMVI